jgi:hypothetical protein
VLSKLLSGLVAVLLLGFVGARLYENRDPLPQSACPLVAPSASVAVESSCPMMSGCCKSMLLSAQAAAATEMSKCCADKNAALDEEDDD